MESSKVNNPSQDDLFLVNAENRGIAVYDALSKDYHWLETKGNIKLSRYYISKDSHGLLWFATNGEIFRSNLTFPQGTMPKANSIDIANAFANGKKLNNILGETESLFLNHTENNLQVNFSLTNNLLYQALTYQYQIDNKDWIEIIEENKLNLFDLSAGNHHLSIRVKEGDAVIVTSSISIDVHRPFTSSPLFFALILLGLLGLIGLASAVYFYNKRKYEKATQTKSKYETRLVTLESQSSFYIQYPQ